MRMMTKQADAATQSLRQRLVNRLTVPARAAKMRAHEIGQQIAASARSLTGKALDRVGASAPYNKTLDRLTDSMTEHHRPMIEELAKSRGMLGGAGAGAALGASNELAKRLLDRDSDETVGDTLGNMARGAAIVGGGGALLGRSVGSGRAGRALDEYRKSARKSMDLNAAARKLVVGG